MKILVTGGAGFIGSHVADRYLELGHDVVIVDDLSTGKERNVNPRARFYRMDIRDRALREVFEGEKPEVINHHAAQVDRICLDSSKARRILGWEPKVTLEEGIRRAVAYYRTNIGNWKFEIGNFKIHFAFCNFQFAFYNSPGGGGWVNV